MEENKETREWKWWETDPLKLVKLEEAFAFGAKDEEACSFADISLDQLYYYTREINPSFQAKKESLKRHPILKAKKSVVDGLDDPELALKYLERKAKDEFSTRTETENKHKIEEYVITYEDESSVIQAPQKPETDLGRQDQVQGNS